MAKSPADRYFTAGDLAAAAHDALTSPEQYQEATILRGKASKRVVKRWPGRCPGMDATAGGINPARQAR